VALTDLIFEFLNEVRHPQPTDVAGVGRSGLIDMVGYGASQAEFITVDVTYMVQAGAMDTP
jgi:hypothetical protein